MIRTSIRTPVRALAIATILSILSLPLLAESAKAAASATTTASSSDSAAAMARVPAQAILTKTLDARKMQAGATFEAKLDGKVHLANGTELPSGTILKGTVAGDDMNVAGNSKLVLRFETAQLKDGRSIPIKATIVGLQTPSNQVMMEPSAGYAEPTPNDWTSGTAGVNQIGVTSGVDLHSDLNSQNSGVFVATTKDNVKLDQGSAVNLAIAAAQPGAQAQSSGE